MHALRKYLRDHAESEISLSGCIEETYERALVVPACREEASLLDGYVAAAETSSGGRTLAILVVNGADDAPTEHVRQNADFLEALKRRLTGVRALEGVSRASAQSRASAFLGTLGAGRLDVLLVDRASAGAGLPPKEGVGLARKIGFDLALALHADGRVLSPLLFGTDADAILPEAFFDHDAARPSQKGRKVSAAVFAFWHAPAPDLHITRATAFYELSLRYYVEGLAWAGSPYAFHTVGSAVAVMAEAYAAVRGMPKRQAAEDFYLLNKLAKVGDVVHVPGRVVHIASRLSDRTPFGTGASVRLALDSAGEGTLYAPDCFRVLRDVLSRLEAFARHGDVKLFFSEVNEFSPAEARVVNAVLEQGNAARVLAGASREAKTSDARRLRVHTWFDAFRTLKLIHAVRDGIASSLPWQDAVAGAPFLGKAKVGEGRQPGLVDASEPALVTLRVRMAQAEAERWQAFGFGSHEATSSSAR